MVLFVHTVYSCFRILSIKFIIDFDQISGIWQRSLDISEYTQISAICTHYLSTNFTIFLVSSLQNFELESKSNETSPNLPRSPLTRTSIQRPRYFRTCVIPDPTVPLTKGWSGEEGGEERKIFNVMTVSSWLSSKAKATNEVKIERVQVACANNATAVKRSWPECFFASLLLGFPR